MNKQEIENKISELENNFKSEIDKLKQELNKNDEDWIPENDEKYWYYDKDYEKVYKNTWHNDRVDNIRLKNKVIFKTEEEAQRYADYQKAKMEYNYKFSQEDWKNRGITKYDIYYDYEDKDVRISKYFLCKSLVTLYFKTEDQAQEFIDKYKSEILEFEFGVKED